MQSSLKNTSTSPQLYDAFQALNDSGVALRSLHKVSYTPQTDENLVSKNSISHVSSSFQQDSKPPKNNKIAHFRRFKQEQDKSSQSKNLNSKSFEDNDKEKNNEIDNSILQENQFNPTSNKNNNLDISNLQISNEGNLLNQTNETQNHKIYKHKNNKLLKIKIKSLNQIEKQSSDGSIRIQTRSINKSIKMISKIEKKKQIKNLQPYHEEFREFIHNLLNNSLNLEKMIKNLNVDFNPYVSFNLATELMSSNSSQYIEEGIELFKKTSNFFNLYNMKKEMLMCKLNQSSCLIEILKNDINSQLISFKEIDELLWNIIENSKLITSENDRNEILAYALANQSETKFMRGELKIAELLSLKALDAFLIIEDLDNCNKLYRQLGVISFAQNNYELSCKYLLKSLKFECEKVMIYYSDLLNLKLDLNKEGKNVYKYIKFNSKEIRLQQNIYLEKNIIKILESFCLLEESYIALKNYNQALVAVEMRKSFQYITKSGRISIKSWISFEEIIEKLKLVNQVVIFHSLTNEELRIWLFLPDNIENPIHFFNLNIIETIDSNPFHLLSQLMNSKLTLENHHSANMLLYQLLISPLNHLLPEDPYQTIIIIPHWDFLICPFSCLMNPISERYFIEEHSYTIFSCSQLLTICNNNPSKKEQDLLSIQNILNLSEIELNQSNTLQALILTNIFPEGKDSFTLQECHDTVYYYVHNLIEAKVPTIITTLWNVKASMILKIFEKEFYTQLETKSHSESFRKSLLRIIENNRHRSSIWGAFQLFGSYK